MFFLGLFAPVVSFLLREVVVKFFVFTAVMALVVFFVPYAIGYLGDFVSSAGFDSAFGMLSPNIWYFLDFFALDRGIPLLISAYVSWFLIRRLPFIG
jgi:hypothetical protein